MYYITRFRLAKLYGVRQKGISKNTTFGKLNLFYTLSHEIGIDYLIVCTLPLFIIKIKVIFRQS